MNHRPLPNRCRPHPANTLRAITRALHRLAEELHWHHIRTDTRDNQH